MGGKDTDEDESPDVKDILLSHKRTVWIDLTKDSDDEVRRSCSSTGHPILGKTFRG